MSKITTWVFNGKRFFALAYTGFDKVIVVDENNMSYGSFYSADRFRKLQKREAKTPPNRPLTTQPIAKVDHFIVSTYSVQNS